MARCQSISTSAGSTGPPGQQRDAATILLAITMAPMIVTVVAAAFGSKHVG
eukprot:CAMPEP_0172911864 /NCGR_PEP_ID=MMETSP1075-20121228/187389_1 /TAXON_ID=2916 /ORGANISM="Ceratium fusus, Strain PA161109" /LENGTH=50 /DNA_ID=CAMNT_0013770251 /DNA_START=443 /DNA_END=591 /DNA_ORIENTATION=-